MKTGCKKSFKWAHNTVDETRCLAKAWLLMGSTLDLRLICAAGVLVSLRAGAEHVACYACVYKACNVRHSHGNARAGGLRARKDDRVCVRLMAARRVHGGMSR